MPSTVRLHRVLATKPEKVYRAFIEADALANPATKALASMARARLVGRQVQRQLHRVCRAAIRRAFVAAAEPFGHVLADRLA
jgi:hypothetical protein